MFSCWVHKLIIIPQATELKTFDFWLILHMHQLYISFYWNYNALLKHIVSCFYFKPVMLLSIHSIRIMYVILCCTLLLHIDTVYCHDKCIVLDVLQFSYNTNTMVHYFKKSYNQYFMCGYLTVFQKIHIKA